MRKTVEKQKKNTVEVGTEVMVDDMVGTDMVGTE